MFSCARTAALFMVLIGFSPLAAANFLRDGPTFPSERLEISQVKSKLQREIERATGHNTSHDVVEAIENNYRDMFRALPKNRYGNVGPSTARYALNRVFLTRNGWQLKGFDIKRDLNSSTPTQILKERVPRYIEELFMERLHGKGFGLHELAVFTATIERFAADEGTERLKGAYKMINVTEDAKVTSEQMDGIMEAFLMVTLLGDGNLSAMSQAEYNEHVGHMKYRYPLWNEAQDFARQIRQEIVYAPFSLFASSDMYTFETSKRVAEEIGKKFGTFHAKECQTMKANLLQVEERESGRVRLGSFYQQGMRNSASIRYSETKSYLREVNELDEFEKNRPRVIIPNYITGPSNCIGNNDFYSICCPNECEGILSHLEHYIGGMESSPRRIAALVAALPSATVPANRQLSASLLKHLDMVANQHHGKVPLHSRLFQQWLHHAYPRECPMPNSIGKQRAMAADAHTPVRFASSQEIQQAINEQQGNMTEEEKAISEIGREELEDLPWTTEEELVVIQEAYEHADFSFATISRNLAFIGIIGASWVYVLDSIATMLSGGMKVPAKPPRKK